jgi:signal transduction histidine kinase/ActR/RegA family two-component response regulator
MRHQAAAAARHTTVLEDIGLGIAVFALCLALTAGIGLWLSYATGALFTLGVAITAWRSGFRPAFTIAILGTAVIGPLTAAVDVRADAVSLTVRVISVGVVSLGIAWLCGNLYRSREQLLIEQARLRESESFHRVIGELASDFAFHARIEPGGAIVIDSATSGLPVLLGYTLEELQHRPGLALARAGAGADVHGDARVIAKDGHLVYVEYSAHPERSEDGRLTGVLGAFRDVSVQREQQVALADERQRLLVDIKMRQEMEGQLRLAKDEAERRAHEAEEARAALKDRERRLQYEAQLKDEFLATLAHELRNPLAPLRNVTEILRLEPLSETALQAAGVMERQIAQLVRLIDDLMDISRISRGHLTLQRQPTDLRTIIDSAVETAQPQLSAAGVSLSTELPEQPCLLDVDATRIAQIFLNLLTNAAKFTPAGGGVWLTVKTGSDRVTVVVRDSGIGIAPEDQDRVFGMFVQLNRDMRRSQTGLGIGLTLVKQMAELHGGTVAVWSEGLGRGSEFTVTLPLAPIAVRAEPSGQPAPAPRPAWRILIADDSEDGADSLSFLLRAAGHEVHTAYDGRTAIRLAEELLPDVVLLDIGMPEVSGYDVARAIRREAWGRAMRLIALTGWGQAEHRRRSLEVGFDEHLVKPVELEVLEEVLQLSMPAPNSGNASSTN